MLLEQIIGLRVDQEKLLLHLLICLVVIVALVAQVLDMFQHLELRMQHRILEVEVAVREREAVDMLKLGSILNDELY